MLRVPLIVSLLLWAVSELPAQIITSGLVGYWNFNEGAGTTLTDLSGNGNDGTLNNSPAWSTGWNGGGLAFDGTNQNVQLLSPNLIPEGNDPRSIAVWVRRDGEVVTSDTIRYQTLVSWGTAGNNGELFSLERGADANYDRVYLVGWNNDVAGTSGGAFPIGTWTHIALTFDGATVRLYVNGVEDAAVARTFNTTLNGYELLIGNNQPNDGWHLGLNGTMDDLYLFDRALSAGEVGQLAAVPEPSAWSAWSAVVAVVFALGCRERKRWIA